MILAKDLIEKFEQAYSEKWGYIYGKSGQLWTQASQDATTNSMALKYGQKWVGHKVADCSGLFVYAFKQLGGSIYHGSNTIWKKYLSASGKIDADSVLKPGTAVFKLRGASDYHHIGLYIGDGVVIEAKGTAYGVVKSKLGEWSHWGELKDVDYSVLVETKPAELMTPGKAKVTGGKLNVRSGPNAKNPAVGKLNNGEEVEILELNDTGKWARVRYATGWVMTKYLTKD